MSAGAVSNEVKRLCRRRVQNSQDCLTPWVADRRRRKTIDPVGVVGRFFFDLRLPDRSPQPALATDNPVNDRRVRLQPHAFSQPVHEHGRGQRAFLGNSGITQPGRRVPDDGLVAVLSATPHKAKAGSSWLGSPPIRLRRQPTEADAVRTFHPSLRLKVMRSTVETLRIVPVMVTFGIGVAVLGVLQALAGELGWVWASLGAGLVLLNAGAIAGALSLIHI